MFFIKLVLFSLLGIGLSIAQEGVSKVLGALTDCSLSPFSPTNIAYILYSPTNPSNPVNLTLDNNNNILNPTLPIQIIIHGWLQSSAAPWITQMKNVYLDEKPLNIIVVDWSYYSQQTYYSASCAVPSVGNLVGQLIYNLNLQNGIPLSSVSINGFSLGAQIAGYAGQTVQSLTSGSKIYRINGLDAAGPGYTNLPENQRLDASDAQFVQGIHTNGGQFGYGPAYGTVDFQVNCLLLSCGSGQTGCPLNPGVPLASNPFQALLPYFFCSHIRAVAYFIESINSVNFIGYEKNGCFGSVTSDVTVVMGENCPSTATGVYYLSTNGNSPFAKGTNGQCNNI